MPTITKKNHRETLWWILSGALLLRLLLAVLTEGYPYDMSCFVAWGEKLAAEGPRQFYSAGYFADYPPGYILVLGVIGALRMALHLGMESPGTRFLLALVPSLCDCAATALLWRVGERTIGPGKTLTRLTLFFAFCPLFLYDTGIWKQIDGAFCLPLILCFLLLEAKRYLPAALLYGVALAIKPQALLAGPVLAVCFLLGVADAFREGERRDILRALGRILGGVALALAPVLLVGLPFFGAQALIPALLEKYIGTTSSYPYATINAFNWFAALGGNWQSLDARVFGLIPWSMLGVVNLLLLTLVMAFFSARSWNARRFSPLLMAGFYTAGVFTLGHCMHERYLVLGVVLVFFAALRWNDIRLYGAAFGLSLCGFVNLAAVYTLVDTDDEWMTSATSSLFAGVTGFAETVCFLLLAFAVYDIAVKGRTSPLKQPLNQGTGRHINRAAALSASPVPQPRWTRREELLLLGLTAATAVLSFTYLGEMTAPQNPLDATGTTLSEAVTVEGEATELWVYPGISFGGSLTLTDGAGQVVYEEALDYQTPFCWTSVSFSATAGQTLTVTVNNAQVFELALRDAEGALVPVSGGGALFDEQAEVPDTISQLNSMYFDEIYHGRTGYEMLHKMTVYETTHPPLGKDFIMMGIALFGMTGFGWRFSGTLFGVLLVPLAWCFVRRLTRKPWIAGVAAVLLSLDFMRYSQSRIATIDIYGTFFILLGAYFMLWYCQSVLQKGVCASLWPMALGGVAFGLGCASKWTGIYAGAGLAILYFAVLYARWRQKPQTFRQEFSVAAVGGVTFYILVPLAIYLLSYLPYRWRDPSFSLSDWWNCQLSMYNYHSTLEATHPFESRWYTWMLDLRPVWYYSNNGLPEGLKGSIAGLGGPVIWLAGLFCILLLLWRQISGRGTPAGGCVLVLYGAQLVPWMMVSRCTFLYHYFPSSIFCLAAIALVLAQMKDRLLARRWGIGLCVAAAVLFVWFYPVLSGLPVPDFWADSLKILPSYGFYL